MVEIETLANEADGFGKQFIQIERAADVTRDLRSGLQLKRARAALLEQRGIVENRCHLAGESNEEVEVLLIERMLAIQVLNDQRADCLILDYHGRAHPGASRPPERLGAELRSPALHILDEKERLRRANQY